ncbi:hypothetical protein [Streptomyces sp. NPDC046939]|uniref:hypothetical protein n=1 Tax=Streptomyces sp. NPDC046939 TaxID=3155376 RepID=UPI0033E8AC35
MPSPTRVPAPALRAEADGEARFDGEVRLMVQYTGDSQEDVDAQALGLPRATGRALRRR